jgi:DNA polymerase III alpha subunit
MSKKIKFVNLHAHSHYSLLDGICPVEDHFVETIKQGHKGCCITDHGNYAASFDLQKHKNNSSKNKKIAEAFKENDIKKHDVVMGSELYVYNDTIFNKIKSLLPSKANKKEINEVVLKLETHSIFKAFFVGGNKGTVANIGVEAKTLLEEENFEEADIKLEELASKTIRSKNYKYNHITLMAKNEIGHRNLCRLTSIGSLPEHFYTRPRIPLSILLKHKEGLVATTGCFIGMIPQAIYKETGEEEELIELFLKEFGEDFYIEIHTSDISKNWDSKTKKHIDQGFDPQKKVNVRLFELIKKYKLENKSYITQDSHMPTKEHKTAQDIMIKSDKSNNTGWHFFNTYYIMSVDEMWESVQKTYPEIGRKLFETLCENTLEVLDKCKNININSDIKLLKIDYANHYLNNPFTVSGKFMDFLEESEVISGKDDRFIVREIIKKEYCNNGNLDNLEKRWGISLNGLDLSKHQIEDCEATKAQETILDDIDKKLETIKKEYGHERDVRDVLRESESSIGLRTSLKIVIHKSKFDFADKIYRDRFFEEARVISLNGIMDLSDYFTPFEQVSFFVTAIGKTKGLGRGSGVASLFVYGMDITAVDPIKWDLMFSRFMQPARIGLMGMTLDDFSFDRFKYKDDERDAYIEVSSLLKESSDKATMKELYYLKCNPEYARYLLNVKKELGSKVLKNTNNSTIAFKLGIADAPTGKIVQTPTSLPDIDYDSNAREEICYYFSKLYGSEYTTLIGIYGALQMKSAFKKVLGIEREDLSFFDINKLTQEFERTKLSEEEAELSELDKFSVISERNSELCEFFKENESVKNNILDLLGTYSHSGIHAGGIVSSSVPIIDEIPCTYNHSFSKNIKEKEKDKNSVSKEKSMFVTQCSMEAVEDVGFVKFDFLEIKTLDDIEFAIHLVKKNHGVDLKFEDIIKDCNNLEVLKAFSDNCVTGIFQFNTDVNKATLAQIKLINDPNTLPFLTSIHRPGPMGAGMHKKAIKIINGDEPPEYLHDSLIPILKDTFGIMAYQEQVMAIGHQIGGLTLLESDAMRRAMSKKKLEGIKIFEEKFIENAHKNHSIPTATCKKLWDEMAFFAQYGFNKSHAVAYALTSYAMMWIKVKYPMEFMASILSRTSKSNSASDKEKFKEYQAEWKSFLLPPNINESEEDYAVSGDKILTPFFAVNRIKHQFTSEVIGLRPFSGFRDFIIKLKINGTLKKDQITSLIYSGVLDSFNPDTSDLTEKEFNNQELTQDEEFLISEKTEFFKIFKSSSVSSELESIITKISNGIGISEEEVTKLKESRILTTKIGKYAFRKCLFEAFFLKLRRVDFPKNINDKIKAAKAKGGAFKVFSKDEIQEIIDSHKIAKSKSVSEDGEKIMAEIAHKDTSYFAIKEMEYMNYTNFNFESMFRDKIASATSRESSKFYTSIEADSISSDILFKINNMEVTINDCVSKAKDDSSYVGVAALLVLEVKTQLDLIMETYESDKVAGRILSRTSKKLHAINPRLSLDFLSFTYLSMNNSQQGLSKKALDTMPVRICGILTKDDHNKLYKISPSSMKKKNNTISNINSLKELCVKWSDYVVMCIAKECILEGSAKIESIAKLTSSNAELKQSKLYAEALRVIKELGINSENRDYYKKLFSKLKLDTSILSNVDISEVREVLIEDVAVRSSVEESSFSKGEIVFMKSASWIMGTAFLLPKKYKNGIKDYTSKGEVKKLFRFKILDQEKVSNILIFDAESYKVLQDKENKAIYNVVDNFKPMAIKVNPKISFDYAPNGEITYIGSSKGYGNLKVLA